jgi:hypothetical protein
VGEEVKPGFRSSPSRQPDHLGYQVEEDYERIAARVEAPARSDQDISHKESSTVDECALNSRRGVLV